ncbi:NUDIX domain-containing protein [Patescibacteria group bacterium]|nr:NUDIX domain-containing protein [Patescibacteria group bacterium]
MGITRHFTATAFVVNDNKVLLHTHKNLDILLPVGGHIDDNELPEQAALREVQEETGLHVELYQSRVLKHLDDVVQLQVPMHFLLEDISSSHQHMDFIYYAKAFTDNILPEDADVKRFMWLTMEEVQSKEMWPNVRMCALEALQLLKD